MTRTAYTRQSYSGTTPTTITIVGTLGVGDTTATISSATGWPSTTAGGFTATIGAGTAEEEQIFVGTRSGTALSNITRGFNGTTDQTHSANIGITHTSGKHDYDEANLAVTKTVGQATAVGQILVVDAANSFAAVQAKTSGQILVGDGTTLASVAVSGDATLASTGALTVANNAITNAKMADNSVDSAEIVAGAVDLTHLSSDFTTAGKALLDDADAAAQRTTLGLGTAATSASSAFVSATAAFSSYSPTLTQSGTVAKTDTYSNYIQIGDLVIFTGLLTVSGSGSAGQAITISLPVTAATSGAIAIGTHEWVDASIFANSSLARGTGVCSMRSTTAMTLAHAESSDINNGDGYLTAGIGASYFAGGLASGDTISWTVMYEAA